METALVIPKYSRVAERFGSQMETVWEGTVDLAWRRQYVGVEKIVRGRGPGVLHRQRILFQTGRPVRVL